jgi:maleylpyruvate isomerase
MADDDGPRCQRPRDDSPRDNGVGNDSPRDDSPGDDSPRDDSPRDDSPGDDSPGDDGLRPGPQLRLRLARPQEEPAVRQLVVEAYQHYLPRLGRPPAPMDADYAALIRAGQVTVAEGPGGRLPDEQPANDHLIGLIVVVPGPDHLLLENIAVRPGSQGHGVGSRLMQFAEQEAIRLGLPAVELYTNELMTENLAYYGRQGYVETDRREQHGFRRVFLRKPVASGRESQHTGTMFISQAAIERLQAAHSRLDSRIDGLADATVRAPSRLPGWTVGHVLCHLARNADSVIRRLAGADRDEIVDQYPGGPTGRAEEIENGARASAAVLIADVRRTNLAVEELVQRLPEPVWERLTRSVTGSLDPASSVVLSRIREVEVHHVDLGLGYEPKDWPEGFVHAELATELPKLAGRTDPAQLLAWLSGRAEPPTLHAWR